MTMDNKPITWFQVNNLVPIIFMIIAMVMAFGTLKSDVALLSQKQDTIIAQQKEILSNVKDVVAEQQTLALKQRELETRWTMYIEGEK